MSDISILSPSPEAVSVDGKSVRIRPVQLKDFELFGRCAQALIEALSGAGLAGFTRYAQAHADELRKVLRATTSLSRLSIRRMSATTSIAVFVQVVRVNAGFFAEALPEMVRALDGARSPSA